jgi:hypothetical protein
MKTLSPFFLFSFLLLSCSQQQKKIAETQIVQKTDTTITVPKITNEQSVDTPIVLSKSVINNTPFFKDYIENIEADTEMVTQSKNIKIDHSPITRGYSLPTKYLLDEETQKKKPFISYTRTMITIDSSRLFITNDQINSHLDSSYNQLKQYGVLLLDKSEITIVKDDLKLSYSYSIPYTDLGTSIIVLIDLKTGGKSISAE